MPRSFEVCKNYKDITLPKRSTAHAAGYDFYTAEEIVIPSLWKNLWSFIKGKGFLPTMVQTHVKAQMSSNEVLLVFNRSSNPAKGLILANGVGVVDADYYGNQKNDGDIGFAFYNVMPWDITIQKNQRIGQGLFLRFWKVDGDKATGTRTGGFGSTGA